MEQFCLFNNLIRKERLPSFTHRKAEDRQENDLPKGTELISNIPQHEERASPRGRVLGSSLSLSQPNCISKCISFKEVKRVGRAKNLSSDHVSLTA